MMNRVLYFLILLLAYLSSDHVSYGSDDETMTEKPGVQSTDDKSNKKQDEMSDDKIYLPHVLTSRNFGSSISDGNVWLYVSLDLCMMIVVDAMRMVWFGLHLSRFPCLLFAFSLSLTTVYPLLLSLLSVLTHITGSFGICLFTK